MKCAFIIIFLAALSTTESIGQVNPLGVYIDIDGKVKFWETEENRNGHLEDSVLITFNGKTELSDLRNFKYDYLTIVEAPRARWTLPNNIDPSIRYDTTQITRTDSARLSNAEATQNFFPFFWALKSVPKPVAKTLGPAYFMNDIRGAGLNDSILNIVKSKLTDYANTHYNKYLPDEARNDLRTELSSPDTVINGITVYDYLVDMLVIYDYDKKKRLSRVLGYHWDYGVELDSLKYNKAGNLIYFSRESIGGTRNEYFFKYNKLGKVSDLLHQYSSVGHNADSPSYTNPDRHSTRFTYDKTGRMNTQSHWQKEKTWLTSYFEIK
jgi:YD repeat-containing protein